ncbi:MAG: hypothetical protein CMJ33_06330 [Phycisphaerae bacterium]|nr:hypothetical protein [Phycisphaerae bacterium]
MLLGLSARAQDVESGLAEVNPQTGATIDGRGPGWRALGQDDFINVNCDEDTWTWKNDSVSCTGRPIGVTRTKKVYTNFELVCEWRHLRDAVNSGIFLWGPRETFDRLNGPGLPEGIEVQVLDLGYKAAYERGGNPADWFTCHGDVFPVGASTMKPFPPISPNGRRSFPTEERTLGVGEWNHYYIRAINGEVRLWVNGAEVSGGSDCNPATGHIALESEGSPIEFRGLRIRELP